MLTQYASWRWTLLINVPIAILAAVFATRLVRESRGSARKGYDVSGAITATGGLLALVYGFTRAQSDGWGSSVTLGLVAAAAVLLASFVLIERRSRHPLLPLRVILDRNRGGAFIASLLVGIAMFGTFLFLTYYFQGTLGYSALKTGFAFLPFSLGIIAGATLSSRLLPRIGPRALMVGGFVTAAIGLFLFTRIGVHTNYLVDLLPAEVIVSFGMGSAFVPLLEHGTYRGGPQRRGRRECHGEHHPADGGVTRGVASQHGCGYCDGQLSHSPRHEPTRPCAGTRTRLHHLVHHQCGASRTRSDHDSLHLESDEERRGRRRSGGTGARGRLKSRAGEGTKIEAIRAGTTRSRPLCIRPRLGCRYVRQLFMK